MKSQIITLFLILSLSLFGQFGKNKIQYKDFKWEFIQTTHFDIYFYSGGEAIAEFTADITEEVYKKISDN